MLASGLSAQPQPLAKATVVAGNSWVFPISANGGPATAAPLGTIGDLTLDSNDNIYFTDTSNGIIGIVSPSGVLTVIAGVGTAIPYDNSQCYSGLGMWGVAIDGSKNVYFSEPARNQISKLTPGGVLTAYAGSGIEGYSGDGGLATKAKLSCPGSLALDQAGNLYIGDTGSGRVRKVDSQGLITTFAGARISASGPGLVLPSVFSLSLRVFTDSSGNVYISDVNYTAVVTSGTVSLMQQLSVQGTVGIAVASSGVIYVSNLSGGVSTISGGPNGSLTTVAGTPGYPTGYSGDGGPPLNAKFKFGFGGAIRLDSKGNLIVADSGNIRIRKITIASSAPQVTTVAGNGEYKYGGDGGPATMASLNAPTDLTFDSDGNLYIAEGAGGRVRRVTPGGTISTYAGIGFSAGAPDPYVPTHAVISPLRLAMDSANELYIMGGGFWRVAPSGPTATFSLSSYGAAALAVDASRNVYYSRILSVAKGTDYTPITVAGNGQSPQFGDSGGDGGPATAASVYVSGLAFDAAGNMLIADELMGRIRRVNTSGIISTIAGDESAYVDTGDGGAALAAGIAPLNMVSMPPATYTSQTSYTSVSHRAVPSGRLPRPAWSIRCSPRLICMSHIPVSRSIAAAVFTPVCRMTAWSAWTHCLRCYLPLHLRRSPWEAPRSR